MYYSNTKSKHFVHLQCQWSCIHCAGIKLLPLFPTAEIIAGYLDIRVVLYNSRLFPVYLSLRCGCVPELGAGLFCFFFTLVGLSSHLVLKNYLGQKKWVFDNFR